METFVWNEHFITGEAQVDAEHQELVRIINWIIGHQKSAAEKMELGKVLDDLVQYAATHFTHETELMVAGGCDPRFLRTCSKPLETGPGRAGSRRMPSSSSSSSGKLVAKRRVFLAGCLP